MVVKTSYPGEEALTHFVFKTLEIFNQEKAPFKLDKKCPPFGGNSMVPILLREISAEPRLRLFEISY